MVSDEDTASPGCNRDCGANGEMFSSGKPGLLLGSLQGLSVLLKNVMLLLYFSTLLHLCSQSFFVILQLLFNPL